MTKFLLLCVFSIMSACSFVNASSNVTAQMLADEIFEHYNLTKMDGMLSLYNDMSIFASITSNLAVKVDDHVEHGLKDDDHEGHEDKHIECILPEEMLKMHNVSATRPLTKERFEHMSPSLIYLATSKACWKYALAANKTVVNAEELKKELALASNGSTVAANDKLPIGLVWLYSFLANTIITLAAAIGILLVPLIFKHPVFGDILMTFLIALGASVLVADALLHLIPDVLFSEGGEHAGHDHSSTVWYSTVMMAGIYVFWAFERYLHSKFAHCHCNSRQNAGSRSTEETSGIINARNDQDVETATEITPKPVQNKPSMINDLKTAKPVAILIILGDFFHNFVDGVAIGASFATSFKLGLTTSLAILFHEIPHELGDYTVLLASGLSKSRAAMWNMAANLSAFGGMILGILLIQNASDPSTATKWILAIAAGFFLYIGLGVLLPELGADKVLDNKPFKVRAMPWARHLAQHLGLIIGWLIMLIIALFGEQLSL